MRSLSDNVSRRIEEAPIKVFGNVVHRLMMIRARRGIDHPCSVLLFLSLVCTKGIERWRPKEEISGASSELRIFVIFRVNGILMRV